ncbi:MAG: hypothetical protein HY326_01320 [Chloroflexi bacterium]|nr:hypothetical protein [Chloroflexota bacterium]
MRLLLAIPDPTFLDLMHCLLDTSLVMVPLQIESNQVTSKGELMARVHMKLDDVIVLGWPLVGTDTPDLVREIIALNPQLRVIVLLPLELRQYRQYVWAAGACSSIPMEYLDAKWLCSALCLITRAMQREARLTNTAGSPVVADATTCGQTMSVSLPSPSSQEKAR